VPILNIPVDGRKYQAKVRLYLPPDLSEGKCYPLVINVYSGLNYQQVNNRFKQLGRGAATFIYQVD
jgi:predicted peptidase